MKRLNKEIKINNFNSNFNIKFGTVNSNNKNAIYVFGTTYITPFSDKLFFGDDILSIRKDIKFLIKKTLLNSSIFNDNFMLDIDIRDSGIKQNKKSFMSLELHLLKNNKFEKISDITGDMEDILKEIFMGINTILNRHCFKNFLYKTKKISQ